jgi:hypothetical protein
VGTISELVGVIRADGADTNPNVAELCMQAVDLEERDERAAARLTAIAALAGEPI